MTYEEACEAMVELTEEKFSQRFAARLDLSNWFMQKMSDPPAATRPHAQAKHVGGSDLVSRLESSFAQIDSHYNGCTCDPCCTSRAYLERMRDFIGEVYS